MAVKGELSLPGDKSISHRALMLATIGKKESIISNLSTGADVLSTRNCLKSCGIDIKDKNNSVIVKGGSFKDPESFLDCGNSGTTIRLMAGLLAGQGVDAELYGDKSLMSRPMDRIIKPLKEMGVDIKLKDNVIHGMKLPNQSSQLLASYGILSYGDSSPIAPPKNLVIDNNEIYDINAFAISD